MPLMRSVAALLLVGCAHGGPAGSALGEDFRALLVEPNQCRAPAAPVLARADAAADLAVAERVLRQGYAGFEPLARAGFDWEGAFARVRAELNAGADPVPIEELRQSVLRALGPTRDSHLALWAVAPDGTWHWGACGRHRDAWTADVVLERDGETWRVQAPGGLAGSTLLECEGRKLGELVRSSFGGRGGARLVVMSDGTPPELLCKLRRADGGAASEALALHRFRLGRAVREGAAFERWDSDGIAVLRLASFGNRYATDLARFVDSAIELRQARAVVVDARGNHEGSDEYVRGWFTRLTRGPLRGATSEALLSEVTLQGGLNRDRCDRAAATDPATIGAAEERLAASRRALAQASHDRQRPFREWKRSTPEEAGAAPLPFRAPLVVIVDAGCAAACETLVTYARQIPSAVIVGENTAGVGAFGEARPYRLPRSGLWMQAGMTWFHDGDEARAAAEGVGYLPDFWLDETDPVPVAVEMARCLTEPGCAARLGRRF